MPSFRQAASMDLHSCWSFETGGPRRCFQKICFAWQSREIIDSGQAPESDSGYTYKRGVFDRASEEVRLHTCRYRTHTDFCGRRISTNTDRKDFMTRILENRDPQDVSDIQIAAHASDFVLAGSETTSTALSCITFYTLRDPEISRRLQAEIRTSFKFYGKINAQSTARLEYLQAVVLEGLRMYPPLPFALPRVVPEGGDIIDGKYVPGGVLPSVSQQLDNTNWSTRLSFQPIRWRPASP